MQMMQAVIDSVSDGVPAALVEIRRLGRTLNQRAADVLAFFFRPGISNGSTEAICESGDGWSGLAGQLVLVLSCHVAPASENTVRHRIRPDERPHPL